MSSNLLLLDNKYDSLLISKAIMHKIHELQNVGITFIAYDTIRHDDAITKIVQNAGIPKELPILMTQDENHTTTGVFQGVQAIIDELRNQFHNPSNGDMGLAGPSGGGFDDYENYKDRMAAELRSDIMNGKTGGDDMYGEDDPINPDSMKERMKQMTNERMSRDPKSQMGRPPVQQPKEGQPQQKYSGQPMEQPLPQAGKHGAPVDYQSRPIKSKRGGGLLNLNPNNGDDNSAEISDNFEVGDWLRAQEI